MCQLQQCELFASAFCVCRSLTSITIPNSVRVTIPQSVTAIRKAAFAECKSLASIAIPEPVTAIGGLCRVKDSILKVTDICSSTFVNEAQRASVSRKYWNKELYVGDFLSEFGSSLRVKKHPNVSVKSGHVQWSVVCQLQQCELFASAFCGCRSLTSITIPNSVRVTIPQSVTAIRKAAFAECKSLASIAIPEPVTAIGGLCRVKDSILKVTDICSRTFVNEAQRASVSRKYWNKELYVGDFLSEIWVFFESQKTPKCQREKRPRTVECSVSVATM